MLRHATNNSVFGVFPNLLGMRRNNTESSIGGAAGINGSAYGLDTNTMTLRARDGSTIPVRPPSHAAYGVWPQLMRAGMQLTMLGFDLTDPSLRGAPT